jgi:hypothetical protein
MEIDCALSLKLPFKMNSQNNASQEICQEPIFIHLSVFHESTLRTFLGAILLGKRERDRNCVDRGSIRPQSVFP